MKKSLSRGGVTRRSEHVRGERVSPINQNTRARADTADSIAGFVPCVRTARGGHFVERSLRQSHAALRSHAKLRVALMRGSRCGAKSAFSAARRDTCGWPASPVCDRPRVRRVRLASLSTVNAGLFIF